MIKIDDQHSEQVASFRHAPMPVAGGRWSKLRLASPASADRAWPDAPAGFVDHTLADIGNHADVMGQRTGHREWVETYSSFQNIAIAPVAAQYRIPCRARLRKAWRCLRLPAGQVPPASENGRSCPMLLCAIAGNPGKSQLTYTMGCAATASVIITDLTSRQWPRQRD